MVSLLFSPLPEADPVPGVVARKSLPHNTRTSPVLSRFETTDLRHCSYLGCGRGLVSIRPVSRVLPTVITPSFWPRIRPGLLLLGLSLASACKDVAPPPAAAVPVRVAIVLARDLPVVLHATGTAEPIRSAAVAPQVDGLITKVAFREGEPVRAGQILFQIDPRPYEATLAQARAVLGRDLAQLVNARQERIRLATLAERAFVTEQELQQAEAAEAALAATVAADSSAFERANLELEYATVRSPISGRAGQVLLREGNLARPASGQVLVQVNQIAPIQVRFGVPAAYLGALRGAADRSLPVRAAPVGDTSLVVTGTLSFLDNAVDTLTGTILLKATFPNREERLWPGALVRVALELAVERGVLVVPRSAIITGQQGASVFVVNDSGKAALRRVTVSRSDDSLAVLSDGVEPDERVVIDGQLRLTDGSPVQVDTARQGSPAGS